MSASLGGSEAKAALRTAVLQRRLARSASDRAAAGEAIAARLIGTSFSQVPTVACYLSTGTEPPTEALLAALVDRGTNVIVPVTASDQTLNWVAYDPFAQRVISPIGVPEPAGA